MSSEAKLLSAVCKNKDISVVLETDSQHLFNSHEDVWDELRSYYFKHKAVPDVEFLSERFADFEPVKVSGGTKFYLDELRDNHIKGKLKGALLNVGHQLGEISGAEALEKLQKEISVISRHADVVRDIDPTNYEDAEEFYKKRKERSKEMGGSPGIPTGIRVVDTFYPTGLAPGHLIVLLGWSGRGKSWFASYLAAKAWSAGFSPMLVSLEMSPEEMRDRVYTILGSGTFSNTAFNKGDIDIDRFHRWAKSSLADRQKFVIVSSEGSDSVTPNTVQAKIDQHRPDIVFCDYHQLFDSDEPSGNETVRNRNISREFKLLAVRNGIPVVDLSQATQKDNSDTSMPPLIEEVAWSRGIQHDANLAISVHKHDDDQLFTVLARKNRHGPLFEFGLDWDMDRGIIKEILGD